MIIDQIAALAASGESETLEFKETTGTRREAAMTVCAFLNQRGGQMLFGVTEDGGVVGQQVSERTIEELSAELRRIEPPAFPMVERVPVDGGREVIVVSTAQDASRPYTYRGTAYRRVGNTTLAMSADEYNRMLFERMHSEQRWENQPAARWSVNDLDVAEIRRTVAEAVRRGRLEEPVSGDPSDMLRVLGLLRDGMLLRAAPLATREALANALCHRDYSIGGGSVGIAVYDDRLEVTSSGSLHFGLTPEKLFAPHESRPWNPLIARTSTVEASLRSGAAGR